MKWVLLFLLLFVVGCQADLDCGDAEDVDACCAEQNAGKALPACVGTWEYLDPGCGYTCTSWPAEDLQVVEECDALNPCPVGDCYMAPDELTAICVEEDPCVAFCGTEECSIAESYPMQVFCS